MAIAQLTKTWMASVTMWMIAWVNTMPSAFATEIVKLTKTWMAFVMTSTIVWANTML